MGGSCSIPRRRDCHGTRPFSSKLYRRRRRATTCEHPFAAPARSTTSPTAASAWNIVTSYLPDAARNFGLDGEVPHDDRYVIADEYLDIIYKLWEGSWDDDDVIQDRVNRVYTDPAKVRYINHVGPHFKVAGPHVCQPSRQRTPVLYQATGSNAGKEFAARHARCTLLRSQPRRISAPLVSRTRIASPPHSPTHPRHEHASKNQCAEGDLAGGAAGDCARRSMPSPSLPPPSPRSRLRKSGAAGLSSSFRAQRVSASADSILTSSGKPKTGGPLATAEDDLAAERLFGELDGCRQALATAQEKLTVHAADSDLLARRRASLATTQKEMGKLKPPHSLPSNPSSGSAPASTPPKPSCPNTKATCTPPRRAPVLSIAPQTPRILPHCRRA